MPSIYIHFPFCIKKCSYCDFFSITDMKNTDKFNKSLIKEIGIFTEKFASKPPVDTLFFGGGTPSLMKPEELELIFNELKKHFNFSNTLEFTVECNPGTIEKSKLEGYKLLGVNRLSIGIQSLIPKELEFLDRIHSPEEALEAIGTGREAGFDNISTDIIFSLPGQKVDDIRYTLENLLKHKPNHISAYNLTYEKGTPLYNRMQSGKVNKNDDEVDAEIFEIVSDTLTESGYEQYEVSNFALSGKKCRHNLNYWNGGEYYAFGPSAHGYFSGTRYWNRRNLKKYFDCIENGLLPAEGSEILTGRQKLEERIMLGLRCEGLNITELNKEFNIDLILKNRELINQLINDGLMTNGNGMLKLTRKGYLLSDEIIIKMCEGISEIS
ncbi:MAG: radical SAM family heme chaperone HemW [Ignavibacteriae bacterium]|nr:radical SAM family heme chaperone HemW [Ignavibacteriota bacterium]